MSTHIHELKVGESLAFKGPIPKFPYVANQFEVSRPCSGARVIEQAVRLQPPRDLRGSVMWETKKLMLRRIRVERLLYCWWIGHYANVPDLARD